MRYVLYTLSALFCLATIVLRMLGQPAWQAIACIVVAAIFVVLGVARDRATGKIRVRGQDGGPLGAEDLSADQKETLRQLLAQGKFGTAVNQVQLWFRHTDYFAAERVVKQLASTR